MVACRLTPLPSRPTRRRQPDIATTLVGMATPALVASNVQAALQAAGVEEEVDGARQREALQEVSWVVSCLAARAALGSPPWVVSQRVRGKVWAAGRAVIFTFRHSRTPLNPSSLPHTTRLTLPQVERILAPVRDVSWPSGRQEGQR